MRGYVFGYTVACLLATITKRGAAMVPTNGSIPSGDQKIITYDEYIIEHEISTEQARNAALTIDLNSIEIPPGCQKCTNSELSYCQGRDFINDHCCCDKRYHELLPYIPHTCYLGTQLCKPIIGDCFTYQNIRKCCCTQHLIKKWKSNVSDRRSSMSATLFLFLINVFLS